MEPAGFRVLNFGFLFAFFLVPKARRASRWIATANAEWRGARTKLENENLARARPVEAGKPGLNGLACGYCGINT